MIMTTDGCVLRDAHANRAMGEGGGNHAPSPAPPSPATGDDHPDAARPTAAKSPDRPRMPMHMTHRRAFLGLSLAALAAPSLAAAQATTVSLADADRLEWMAYRDRYLHPEGRVVDTGNRNVSHTEGQGWSMLFAVRADDRPSFERMLAWTQKTLKRRTDQLHSWRFQPGAANPVADLNNATDGDICMAWALLEAHERWGVADHAALATAISRDILKYLVRRRGGYTVLLPGVRGFDSRNSTILNPSYYVFPAFHRLARAVPDPAWVKVAADGLALMRAGRYGKWRLPPDWVALNRTDGSLSLALPENLAPRFSYDAVRVPLYLSWARLGGEAVVGGAVGFWADSAHPYVPAWTDLTNDAIAPYAAPPGVASIARLAAAQRVGALGQPAGLQRVAAAPDYYSAALGMLVRLAWRDVGASVS